MLLRLILAMIVGMEARLCTDRQAWDGWIQKAHVSEFLQSWEWGEFQKSMGTDPLRFLVYEGNDVAGGMQGFIRRIAPGISSLYIPYSRGIALVYRAVFEESKKYGCAFVHCEPAGELDRRALGDTYTVVPSHHSQPGATLLLDLSLPEVELLKGMHEKTRYNIHLAERKGVEIREGKDARIFWSLMNETKARDGFRSHSETYYRRMLELPIAHQLTAYYHGEPVAAHIYISFNGLAVYLHGASSNNFREVMAPYLLQWKGMQLAKKFGCHTYDFWGVAPQKAGVTTSFHGYSWDPTHSWSGITRFKAGFGGTPHTYPDAFDVVLKPALYWFYRLGRWIRR